MPLPRATSDELIFVGSSGEGNRGRALLSVLALQEGLIGSAAHCELRFADPFRLPSMAASPASTAAGF